MLGILTEIVDWIGPAFAVAGYFIIAGAVLAERSIFIGLFVPGDVLLALGGIFSARGDLEVAWVIVIAVVAATCGESIGFWLGDRYGMALVRRLPLINRLEDKLENAQEYFQKHGGKTVALGRYATAAGAFIPFVAGLGKMPYRRFLAFDVPAIIVWAVAITLVGYFFEAQLDLVDTILSRFGWIMLGLIVAFFLGRYLWKKRAERQASST